jgi:hypothetical protein
VSDRLALLLNAAERLTVDLIAQEPVTVQPTTNTPGWARSTAEKEHFDVLPLRESNGRIVRYVRRTALDRHDSDTEWEGVVFGDILPDDIVSAASPMLELLDRFTQERPLLFVLGAKGIDSVVTVHDLNQPAAHQLGFALSLVVEAELSRAIEREARQSEEQLDTEVDERISKEILKLSRDRHKKTRSRIAKWRAKTSTGNQVRLTQELVFEDKITLVDKMGLAGGLAKNCRHPHAMDGDELLACLRKEVKALRNAVAHETDALSSEWCIWRWMRTTYHLAMDLTPR